MRLRGLLLALLLLMSLCACGSPKAGTQGGTDAQPASGKTGETAELPPLTGKGSVPADAYTDYNALYEAAPAVKLSLGGGAAALSDFAETMEALRDEGVRFLSYGMPWQAEYCLCFALCSVSSLRFTADNLLSGLGEGDLASLCGDRLADWDQIAAISLVCPCPYRLEALAAASAGDGERAALCAEKGALNPQAVRGEAGFDSLKGMDAAALRELKAGLEDFEDHLLALWPVAPEKTPRSGFEFSGDYHLTLASAAIERGESQLALTLYENALLTNPFSGDGFVLCAAQCIALLDPELALYYIEQGLLLDESHPGLNTMAAAFWCAAGDGELTAQYLAAARACEGLTAELAATCDDIEAELKGGDGT